MKPFRHHLMSLTPPNLPWPRTPLSLPFLPLSTFSLPFSGLPCPITNLPFLPFLPLCTCFSSSLHSPSSLLPLLFTIPPITQQSVPHGPYARLLLSLNSSIFCASDEREERRADEMRDAERDETERERGKEQEKWREGMSVNSWEEGKRNERKRRK